MRTAIDLVELKALALDMAMDGVALLDREGVYYYLNASHVKLFGYQHEAELIGKTWRFVYDEQEISRLDKDVFPHLIRDGVWHGITLGKKKDGTGIWQQISLTTLADGGLMCITRSINREVEFEHELNIRTRRLQSIVSSTSEGILLETVDNHIVAANESLKRILSLPSQIDELIGQKCFDALQSIIDLVAHPDLFIREIKNNLAKGKLALNQVVVMLNGRVLSRDFIPLDNNGQLEGYLWVYRDITEQEIRKEELRKLFERERELNNMKSKFVHTVSHEFKRPVLNTLRGASMLKMLMREHEGLEPLNRTVDALIDELDKLNRQVNRLVNYESLLVEQQLDLKPVNIRHLVSNFLNYNFSMFMASEKFDIHDCDTGHAILTDMNMLNLVLSNLVENALKYTDFNSRIFIGCQIDNPAQMVSFTFSNPMRSGHMVNTALLGNPMYRGSKTDDNGLGLGLAIIQSIISMHKGTMTYKVEDGVYIAIVSLPLAPSRA